MEGSASDSFTLMTSTMPSQQQHHQEEPMQNKQHLNSSIFSLTLDEFRTKSGKNFDSINFDEFLSSVWGEENQSCPIPNQNEPTNSVPIPLSGKTLEEVWSDILRSEMEQDTPTPVTNHDQTPLGEMTLEDFLVKAGVIRESPRPPPPPPPQRIPENYNFPRKNSHLDVNMNVGAGQIMGYDLSVQPNSNVVSNHGPSMYQLYSQSGGPTPMPLPPPPTPQHSNFDIEKCNNSGSDGSEPSSKKAKRNMCDEAFDRRQRRMIKNRESAARSRARKQAYTAELEIELNQLKEDNTRLKLALATAERKLHEYEEKEKKQTMKMQRKGEKTKGVKIGSSLSW
ncbi:hypothetical protein LguiA_021333 [Lonicera macranthoides]